MTIDSYLESKGMMVMASMNETPSGERVHIGFFGRRNAGKSSVVNAVTGQDLAVVSDVRGTTTDPVSKAMEILPLGPVVVIDTPGFDDEGSLGELRVKKTRQILGKTDIAVLVVDSTERMQACDMDLVRLFEDAKIPYILVLNKTDLASEDAAAFGVIGGTSPSAIVKTSALTGEGIHELKEKLASLKPSNEEGKLISDKINPGDLIILVVPIDKAAPKGRLILPQQQVIRDILDSGATALVLRESELEEALSKLGRKPDLVVTDSQVFEEVDKLVPSDVPLTSFSILMARYKGFLDSAIRGIAAIAGLKDGDKVLIAEGCTHHRQCGDIGTVKIPAWLEKYTGKSFVYETTSGAGFPEDLSEYGLIIHCGGCMLNEREVLRRAKESNAQGVAITNYGILIAHVHGILKRSIEIFSEYSNLL